MLVFSKLSQPVLNKITVKTFLQWVDKLPLLVLPLLFTIFTLILSQNNFEYISWTILGIGFLSIGLAHGALDHLTQNKIINKKQLISFVTSYLLKGALFGVVWLLIPDLALIMFIGYSAWHFGQADFEEWKLRQGWQSLSYGMIVLMTILFFHFEELIWILKQIPNLNAENVLKKISDTQLVSLQILIVSCGLLLAFIAKSKHILFTLTYLLLTSFLPLVASFGIYFVGQHSIHGWRHLTFGLKERSSSLWLKSLPFSIAGALIILSFMLFGPSHVVVFFIILSCMSIPHVFSMHNFYSKIK